ncbi:MAG: ATP-dependent Clp protease proteolytic subunit [Cyanobacteria bacterium P01_G01_bin.38]
MSVTPAIRVPYNIPGSRNWTWVNIFTRMSQERILFLNQPLTDGIANSLISALLYLDSEDASKPVYLYINSLGDPVMAGMTSGGAGMMSVMAGLAVYDTMQHIKSEIITICMGQAVGMSAVLLSCGAKGKRASLPHAEIALVHPYSGTQGQATDIQVSAGEVLQKQKLVLDILTQTTGQTADKIASDMERMFYLSPQEAVDYGLIDRVIENPV